MRLGGGGEAAGGRGGCAPLAMTRDDCRRTLRRLELEAYASIVSVLRAQGHLRDERRKLLESVRSALHIGSDRHQAEARRASNDQLLAAIADQLSGPNTDLDWAREGRRKIPIFPRGIAQTAYTAIADRAATLASEENSLIARRVSERKAAQFADDEGAEESPQPGEPCNVNYPPVVMTDQSLKVLNDDGPPRKRSRSDAPSAPHRVSHQKHLDLSQIYTCYSKPHSGKASNQYGRNVYNQSGKMSKSNHGLSKSNVSKHRSVQNKHASAKHCGQVTIPHHRVRSGIKSPTDPHIAGSQALCVQNQDAQSMKSQTPAFQAEYAQPSRDVASEESNADRSIAGATVLESPTMQLLTQSPVNRSASASSPMRTEEISAMSSLSHDGATTTIPSNASPNVQSGKACHFIIKKKTDGSADGQIAQKIHFANKPILSKADLGNLKVLQNRPVVVSPSNNGAQKILNSGGNLVATKIVPHVPQKSPAQTNPNAVPQAVGAAQIVDKLLIVPKTPTSTVQSIQRSLCSTPLKNIFISSHSPSKEGDVNNLILKNADSEVFNKQVKIPTKTFLLNSKSGRKMLVVPANKSPKTVIGQSVPLLMKGVQGKPTAMKLVPVSGQPNAPAKTANVTVVPKAAGVNVLGSTKILSKDSLPLLKANPASDSNLPKVISNIQITSKSALQSLKQSTPSKGNVIVVQKGSAMSKNPITLTKGVMNAHKNLISVSLNESHPTEILTDASMRERVVNRESGNLVVLEMNDQLQHGICLAEEYIEGGDESMTQSSLELKSDRSLITEENPGLFQNRIAEEECNADSMESTTDSLMETGNVDDVMKSNESSSEEQDIQKIISEKELLNKQVHLSDFNAWETELGKPEESKNISDKSDDLTLELDISTDSDGDDYAVDSGNRSKGSKQLMQEDGSQDEQEDTNELFVQHSSINQARRTLLSQLQDDGSSSNDSPFLLSKNLETARLELLETSQTSSSAMESDSHFEKH